MVLSNSTGIGELKMALQKRIPRKVKKWGKKNNVRIAFVEGRKIWYYEPNSFMQIHIR